MTENELRGYIRKEIGLNEAAGDFSSQDVKDVWKSFKNIFKVFGTAIKSLLSVLVLNIELIFRTDPDAIKRAFASYDDRSGRITGEYNEVVGPLKEQFGEIEPLLFIANPGAYVAYQFAKDGSTGFIGARTFLRDVGIDIEDSKMLNWMGTLLDLDPTDPANRRHIDSMRAQWGQSSTAGTAGSLESIEATQRKIQQSLDSLFGLAAKKNENVLREQTERNLVDDLEKIYKVGLGKLPPEAFSISRDSLSKIIELKKVEAETFVKSLNAPINFMQLLSKAKTVDEVKKAIETLKNTPYAIDGVNKLTPEFLDSSAKKALDAAKEKKKVEDLFKQIGIPVPTDEKMMLDAVKAFQLRQLLGKTVLDVQAAITKQTERLRVEYEKKYLEDTPLDVLSKIAPGSELEKTVKAGLEKIKNTGKRPV